MRKILTLLSCVAISVTLISAQSNDKGVNELPKLVRNTYAFVPAGKTFVGKDSIDVPSFHMLKTEVSNLTYREFISELKIKGKMEDLAIARVDSSRWRNELNFNEPYVNYYFNYPAYNHYPAVNISYEGAILYCKWLTEKLNQHSNTYSYEVRLPTHFEWLRAAQHGDKDAVYAWSGPYLRNRKGSSLCNYRNIGDESIHLDSVTKKYVTMFSYSQSDNADITAPVYSYYPNEFGLHCMNGNVAEMVAEKGIAAGGSWNSPGYDVRNISTMSFTEPSPFVGFRPVLIAKRK